MRNLFIFKATNEVRKNCQGEALKLQAHQVCDLLEKKRILDFNVKLNQSMYCKEFWMQMKTHKTCTLMSTSLGQFSIRNRIEFYKQSFYRNMSFLV